MLHSRVHIEAGDLVIVFMSRDNMLSITITPGDFFHNKFGRYPHDSMIGQKFGSKMHSPPPHSGYVHLLRPTPELWTLSLPHRTQILYMPDIAYITMRLGVRVGGKVVEAGTGSGSMTHSLARTVGARGNVLSYEYHRVRYEKASEEFESHDLNNVHLEHRNVCKDGFGELAGVEAVFLDLPAPWEAIPYAVKTFRPDIMAKICCFSPCLEQVLKTVSALRAEGFSDVSTQEVLVRTHELVQIPSTTTSHLTDISSIQKRLSDHETRKEERRIVQMRTAREKARRQKEAASKIIGDDQTVGGEDALLAKRKVDDAKAGDIDHHLSAKRMKLDDPDEENTEGIRVVANVDAVVEARVLRSPAPAMNGDSHLRLNGDKVPSLPAKLKLAPLWTEPSATLSSLVLTKPSAEMRGHTSYLTFASFYPAKIRHRLAAQEPSKGGTSRVAELASEADTGPREGSIETDFGSEGMDQVMGTLTEEEMIALVAGTK